MLDNQGPGDA